MIKKSQFPGYLFSEISETGSGDFSSEFSEQEDTSSSEEESPIPSTVSGRRRKKSTKKQTTKKKKKNAENKQQIREQKLEGRTISSDKTELDELADKFQIKCMQPVTKVTAQIVPRTAEGTFLPC